MLTFPTRRQKEVPHPHALMRTLASLLHSNAVSIYLTLPLATRTQLLPPQRPQFSFLQPNSLTLSVKLIAFNPYLEEHLHLQNKGTSYHHPTTVIQKSWFFHPRTNDVPPSATTAAAACVIAPGHPVPSSSRPPSSLFAPALSHPHPVNRAAVMTK